MIKVCALDRSAWRKGAPKFRDYNYRQIWEYGEACARRKGAVSEHVGIFLDGELIGVGDVRIKVAPLIGGGIAYISGGPLCQRESRESDLQTFKCSVHALVEEYVRKRGLVLRIQAPVGMPDWNDGARSCLREFGFEAVCGAREYRTILVDTSASLEEMRRRLSSNWRKNLGRAERRGVSTTVTNDMACFEPVVNLFDELIERKGIFVDLGARFYQQLQSKVCEKDRFTIILAKFEERIVGMLVVSILGEIPVGIIAATSHTGASNYASYMMYWRALELCHLQGKRAFDLAGIDPEGNPNVYNFKLGFRGVEVVAAGPFQVCPGNISGRLCVLGERVLRRAATRMRRARGR